MYLSLTDTIDPKSHFVTNHSGPLPLSINKRVLGVGHEARVHLPAEREKSHRSSYLPLGVATDLIAFIVICTL